MIYCVEDDDDIRELMLYTLRTTGFEAQGFPNSELFWQAMEQVKPDLILLDIMLPGSDGLSSLEELRAKKSSESIPVIMATAKGTEFDKVKGLDMGADDYLTKPFEIIELLARVETVLRRYHKTEQILTEGDLVIDTASHTVKKNGEPVGLTKKEYELLLLFVRNKNIALYRETIYERIWGGEYMGDSRTVDLHVQRMRRKVGWEDKIVTVYKVGYRLEG